MQAVRFSGCQAGPSPHRTARPSTCKPSGCSSRRGTLPVARTRRSTLLVAQASPCVLITAPDGITNHSLQHLASEVRQQLGVQAVVLAPAAASAHASATQHAAARQHHQQHKAEAAGAGPTPAASLTIEQELLLQPCQNADLSYSLAGATAADCVLCAVDQTQGLLRALDLSPVLVLVGVSRGPALSSDMPLSPAVAVAQQAALLGLPAVATCLATTSAAAPMQPAVAATVQLLARVLPVLQHTNSSSSSSRGSGGRLSSARNFPRAHFPFPEEGRWALGTQLPLPHSSSATEAGSSSSWQNFDSWALGDDNSWLGEYSSSRNGSRSGRHGGEDADPEAARQQAYSTLRGAFADGDLLLCLNVPPAWQEAAGFAATRPGVLWHCWQVEAQQGVQQQQQQQLQQPQQGESSSSSNGNSYSSETAAGEVGTGAAAAAAGGGRWSHLYDGDSSSSSGGGSRSWEVDGADLFGRTLPSTSYGSTVPSGSNFVGQDNTRKVLADSRPGAAASSSSYGSGSSTKAAAVHEPEAWGADSHSTQNQQRQLPGSFTVRRGTLLSDAAACGDVEAVFSGRAALSVVQAWPAGHPLSCRDELLLAALDEGAEGSGLPAWLQLE